MDFDTLYREERPRALATLIRLLGDFDLAEEMLQEAFAVAITRWPERGLPANPGAWLVSTARHKALDRIRRRQTFDRKRDELAWISETSVPPPDLPVKSFPDDLLRLVFTCCHPALALEAQVALTLKTLCGLSVDEIARAFLVAPSTMAQRLVRAKGKIRKARIPYVVPEPDRLEDRLEGVLMVVYLVFTEGYAASSGNELMRRELCSEAIRLGRLLHELLPEDGEVAGLLALMLLQDSRRDARVDGAGDLVLLEDQDRGRWDAGTIAEGVELVRAALGRGEMGFYSLQAAIAAVHAEASRSEETDWRQIAALYRILGEAHPSPVVALNGAVAVAMAEGLEAGLLLIEELERDGALDGYHLLHAAKGDLLRRLGRSAEAAGEYEEALQRVSQGPERRFLERRRREMEKETARWRV